MNFSRMSTAAFIAGVTTLSVSLPMMAEERKYDVTGFQEVSIAEGLSAQIEIGPDFDVSAQSPSKRDLDRLSIEVRGNRLIVERDASWLDFSLFAARRQANVKISLPEMKAISASSGSDVYVSGEYGDRLTAEASSGADLELDDVTGSKLKIRASSGSDLRVEGACETLDIASSSGASIRADDLVCQDVTADASSGADIRVHATATLRAEASSGAGIRISGRPEVLDSDESSGGSIRIKD